MFAYRRKRRKLQKRIDSITEKFESRLATAKPENIDSILNEQAQCLDPLELELNGLDTMELYRQARELGIKLPTDQPTWWRKDEDEYGQTYSHLSEVGRIGVSKLIREEKFQNAERWIKLITPIVSALTGLLGALIGILAVVFRR